ncbi:MULTISPECIES: pimeloyl-ACP methyl ester esterase BioH [Edwardsiella]|uniref:Pimeloyl-[acyl-carrier protein] methyl ester esterase n=2 Tax=Edwardsiella anguillarum TaxID=1821960 RepID=A0A076LHI7_9GAMM|nr:MULTISPECIES: pimeloyl-ACP methyl ester esterase BioH [Edwardsiella]AKM46619.1 carboxylesterase [Edwardsiella sp. EA181011]GAJ67640.1 biotin synthesis protein BioH [Edwardsiella piscicida]AIJ07965.1 hydrolase or acyltransferase [Edwardsiella anguillarum ET080813]AKR79056.1 pimeloyl-ACP methyl ester esterase BioH [Edwardsiella sp. LADL05-105]KAB0591813.1 pimeloyl-ACP methyl ester esterase BioH [Edwardsiella anguillarum]
MSALFWHTCGAGKRDLVLLHGWGLNAEVWRCIVPQLSAQFRLHLVDLPGYGRSGGDTPYSLAEMTQRVLAQAPERALWLGWSLGGLVATQAALHHPQRVSGLITVASSPCFTAQTAWPGIRGDVLHHFQSQLRDDFQRTVERFLALQTLGTDSARQDARALKSVVLAQPMPSAAVLNGGLSLLRETDLRPQLATLAPPWLRLYGALDGLVPRRVVPLVDALSPRGRSLIIPGAAHAPFISHPAPFCAALCDFAGGASA